MLTLTKHDLQYQYTWTAIPPDDRRLTGAPDDILLNRHEGYEVLHFLKRHCQDANAARKAERLIQTQLPGDVRSRARVLEWLQRNWAMYA